MPGDEFSVSTVADARIGLSRILREFRANPDAARPVTIGSHRRAEAVLMPIAQFHALTATPPKQPKPTLRLLAEQRDLILRLAKLSNIDEVAVFGSVARGSDSESSDIDLLVDPSENASLLDLAQFEIDMTSLTGRDVDVVSRRALDPVRDQNILAEAISL